MTAAIKITRDDFDAAGFCRDAARTRDSNIARRLLALALISEGKSRTEAETVAGMDCQTLRDWVHRYNDLGVDGLADRKSRPKSLHR